MAISDDLLKAAVSQIAQLGFVAISPDALVEDVVLLAKSWPEEDDFSHAVASNVRALEQLDKGVVAGAELARSLEGWRSYHYQLRRSQGQPANLRIVYRPTEFGIEVKGFGHRYRPIDLYRRVVLGREG